jgi:hypothetical protein
VKHGKFTPRAIRIDLELRLLAEAQRPGHGGARGAHRLLQAPSPLKFGADAGARR